MYSRRQLRRSCAPGSTRSRGHSKFDVTYHGFSDEAKTAFQAAVDVWSVTLTSSDTIRVDAHWTPLDDPRVLGSAGPESFLRDFSTVP